jgi:hypothetical protein
MHMSLGGDSSPGQTKHLTTCSGTTGAKPDHRPLEKEKRMGKIALTLLTSLDGVMQSPGSTDVPFKYRGWTLDFDLGPEGN